MKKATRLGEPLTTTLYGVVPPSHESRRHGSAPTCLVLHPHPDQPTEVAEELLLLPCRAGRLHGLDQQSVEVGPGYPLGDDLLEVPEMLPAPGVVPLGLEVLVRERQVGVELLVVGAVGVGDLDVRRH